MRAKAGLYSGKHYSAVGTGSNQTVFTGVVYLGWVSVTGTGTFTLLDGSTQFLSLTAPVSLRVEQELLTSLVVNGPVGATLSAGYN